MRFFFALVLLGTLLLAGVGTWMQFESSPPEAKLLSEIKALGRKTSFDVQVRAGRQGLRSVKVQLRSGAGEQATIYPLAEETMSPPEWFATGVTEKVLHVEPDLGQLKIPEGEVTLEVFADTYAWHLWRRSEPALIQPLAIDLTAPKLELLTNQHNLRLGGAELAVIRQSSDTVSSGVTVGDYFFPALKGFFTDPDIALAMFAVPQDLDTNARVHVVARDAAGNERSISLPCRIKPQKFPDKTLNINDDFLQHKVPDIEEASGLPRSTDQLQGYLYINRELRKQNEKQLRAMTAVPKAPFNWDGAFHRQTNAAPLSAFADRRTYMYDGKIIDHQTHLGYDLASLKLAPVEATQNGLVIFAGDLGIYGNTVVLDHGLGIYSLYGHMSSISVKVGDTVKKAQPLGQSGETGLAGGDHIHYSIMLYGIHVDPVEWWDPHWLKDHILPKLDMFPRAAAKE